MLIAVQLAVKTFWKTLSNIWNNLQNNSRKFKTLLKICSLVPLQIYDTLPASRFLTECCCANKQTESCASEISSHQHNHKPWKGLLWAKFIQRIETQIFFVMKIPDTQSHEQIHLQNVKDTNSAIPIKKYANVPKYKLCYPKKNQPIYCVHWYRFTLF